MYVCYVCVGVCMYVCYVCVGVYVCVLCVCVGVCVWYVQNKTTYRTCKDSPAQVRPC
jgi:hypothetical protein